MEFSYLFILLIHSIPALSVLLSHPHTTPYIQSGILCCFRMDKYSGGSGRRDLPGTGYFHSNGSIGK